jgi:N-formylglutamate deformylase
MTAIYDYHRGTTPLLISIPHAGTDVPQWIAQRFTPDVAGLPDTDWFVDQLYAFARDIGASIIKANLSRYVVDLNRSPDSKSLYAAKATSPVCATESFAGATIYRTGEAPDAAEISTRIDAFWRPYHDALEQELQLLKRAHGKALLWDAHSIASEVPGLFEGVLPEFNFGTRDGKSCPPAIADELLNLIVRDGEFGAVVDGRFKGGYITMNYGRPVENVFAVQLELAERVYMSEVGKPQWRPERAERAQARLRALLECYVSEAVKK